MFFGARVVKTRQLLRHYSNVVDARNPILYTLEELRSHYNRAKHECFFGRLETLPTVRQDDVFATNETDLTQIKVYGFDYDVRSLSHIVIVF